MKQNTSVVTLLLLVIICLFVGEAAATKLRASIRESMGDWQSAAEAACAKEGRHADTNNLVMRNQCKTKCTKQGEKATFHNLMDGTACEKIGLAKQKGTCKDGICL